MVDWGDDNRFFHEIYLFKVLKNGRELTRLSRKSFAGHGRGEIKSYQHQKCDASITTFNIKGDWSNEQGQSHMWSYNSSAVDKEMWAVLLLESILFSITFKCVDDISVSHPHGIVKARQLSQYQLVELVGNNFYNCNNNLVVVHRVNFIQLMKNRPMLSRSAAD